MNRDTSATLSAGPSAMLRKDPNDEFTLTGIAVLFRIVSCVSRIALLEPRRAGACFFTLTGIVVLGTLF